MRALAIGFAVMLGMIAAPAMARDQKLLNFIGAVESRGNYDALYHGLKQRPSRPITQLSVGDVMQFQRNLRGVTSTALGRYQFIKDTLRYLVAKHRIDPKTKFDAALQDRLAWELVRECAPKRRSRAPLAFANCLAQIWAGLPRVSGPKYGLSHYDGIAGNKALVTPAQFLAALGVDPGHNSHGTVILAQAEPTSAQNLSARYAKIRAKMLENQRGLHRQVGNQIIYSVDPYRVE